MTFAAPPYDMVEDLCGDPEADLVVFLAGNQFMVLPELVAGFRAAHPQVRSVFYETLPPGVLVEQFRSGGIRVGSLTLSVRPDVLALSPEALARLYGQGLVGVPCSYARNDLALLVAPGNPVGIRGWADLARPGVRVAFPDPRTEGIGRLALTAAETAGGRALRAELEGAKAATGELVYTTIHHRQGPAWLAEGSTDVAVVWSTEARHHLAAGTPVQVVTVPPEHNREGGYAAAAVNGAAHPEAAASFVAHLCGAAGRAVYAAYGFSPPM